VGGRVNGPSKRRYPFEVENLTRDLQPGKAECRAAYPILSISREVVTPRGKQESPCKERSAAASRRCTRRINFCHCRHASLPCLNKGRTPPVRTKMKRPARPARKPQASASTAHWQRFFRQGSQVLDWFFRVGCQGYPLALSSRRRRHLIAVLGSLD